MKIGSLTVDSTGVVTWVDPRVITLLALPEEQCVSRPLAELLQFSDENRQLLTGFLLARQSSVMLQQVAEDDVILVAQIHVLLSEPPSSAGAGRQYRCQLSIRDDALADRTALAAVQLRSTIQSIIAGFAHEVRNPLAAILSIAEAAIQENAIMPNASAGLARIPALVGRIEALIRQANDYSKPALPKKKEVLATSLIDGALEILSSRYTHITTHKDVDAALPAVQVDVGQIERTLINLVDNACYAARSKVMIRARRAKMHAAGAVLIEIRDDGPGIAENIQRRIFEPFFTTKAKGTGLGLALARDLARMNGGNLRLHASGPEGTSFHLLLPIKAPVALVKEAS